jgi:hypothetical protein
MTSSGWHLTLMCLMFLILNAKLIVRKQAGHLHFNAHFATQIPWLLYPTAFS